MLHRVAKRNGLVPSVSKTKCPATRRTSAKKGIFFVRFHGKEYKKSLKTRERGDAEAARRSVEQTIHRLVVGLIQIPLDVGAGDFILSGGTLLAPVRPLGTASREKLPTTQKLIDEYLESQKNLLAESYHYSQAMHLRHLVRHLDKLAAKTAPRFAPAVEIADLKIRCVPCAVDWDQDGRVDVIAIAASGEVVLIRNLGANGFASAAPLQVPAVPYGPSVSAVDWNGDGDVDLIVGTDYGYFCWFERSFLERGYARAQRVEAVSPR